MGRDWAFVYCPQSEVCCLGVWIPSWKWSCLFISDSFLMLTTRGPDLSLWPILAHKKKSRYDPQLFWVNLEEENVLIKKITTFGVKGWLVLDLANHYCHTTAEIRRSAVELVHRECMWNHRYLYPYNGPKIGKHFFYKNQMIMGT